MKHNILWGLMAIVAVSLVSSCDDDDPPAPALLEFVTTEVNVKESTGDPESFHPALLNGATGHEVDVTITFDKPAPEAAVVAFSLSGTATRTTPANPVGDYAIEGNNFTIEKGATEAVLTFTIFEDIEFEDDAENNDGAYYEDIVLTLTSVVSGPVQLGQQTTFRINILEDDVEIALTWDAGGGHAGDADLDMYLWVENDILGSSARAGTQFEGILIPGGFFNETFGVSYTYYSGSSDDLTVISTMINHGGKVNNGGPVHERTASYTLANLNRYDDDQHPDFKGLPMVVQYLEKDGHDYEVSPINVPPSGSRIGYAPGVIHDRTKNNTGLNLELLRTYLQFRSAKGE